jgi:hypothetical protein
MDREALVYVDLDGVPHLMGRLWARTRKNKESATFEYDKTWLENPAQFSLEPALQVGPGPFHTPADTPMFGAIGDSAPDRWGRALMRRMERRRAEREGDAPRTLQEIDFLLLVNDEARQGRCALRKKKVDPSCGRRASSASRRLAVRNTTSCNVPVRVADADSAGTVLRHVSSAVTPVASAHRVPESAPAASLPRFAVLRKIFFASRPRCALTIDATLVSFSPKCFSWFSLLILV